MGETTSQTRKIVLLSCWTVVESFAKMIIGRLAKSKEICVTISQVAEAPLGLNEVELKWGRQKLK